MGLWRKTAFAGVAISLMACAAYTLSARERAASSALQLNSRGPDACAWGPWGSGGPFDRDPYDKQMRQEFRTGQRDCFEPISGCMFWQDGTLSVTRNDGPHRLSLITYNSIGGLYLGPPPPPGWKPPAGPAGKLYRIEADSFSDLTVRLPEAIAAASASVKRTDQKCLSVVIDDDADITAAEYTALHRALSAQGLRHFEILVMPPIEPDE
jgi:hypothetical protein